MVTPDYEEILDLVDDHDEVVDTITHDQVYDMTNLRGHFLRSSHVFIVNTSGQLWIPKRLATKKMFPSSLDYSAAEHVASGESYDAAAVRGAAEELGLSLQLDDLTRLPTIGPSPVSPYFKAFYLYFSDAVPAYSQDDYNSWQWLSPQALIDTIKAGTPAKPMLEEAAAQVLDYLAEHKRNQ